MGMPSRWRPTSSLASGGHDRSHATEIRGGLLSVTLPPTRKLQAARAQLLSSLRVFTRLNPIHSNPCLSLIRDRFQSQTNRSVEPIQVQSGSRPSVASWLSVTPPAAVGVLWQPRIKPAAMASSLLATAVHLGMWMTDPSVALELSPAERSCVSFPAT